MRVARWGNGLAVRLPSAVIQSLDLREGDEIDLQVIDARTLAVERSPGTEELLARLRSYRGRLPPGFRFDRLEANSR